MPSTRPAPQTTRQSAARRPLVTAALFACLPAASAHADIARTTQEVLVPFDDAQMVAEWIGPSVAVPGVVRWSNAQDPAVNGTLFDVSEARAGDTTPLFGPFRGGDRLRLTFGPSMRPDIGHGNGNGWQHHRTGVVAFEDLSFGLEPSGPPRGRGNTDPFEEALFVLRFTNAPAPSAAALFGLGGLMLAARRRRPTA